MPAKRARTSKTTGKTAKAGEIAKAGKKATKKPAKAGTRSPAKPRAAGGKAKPAAAPKVGAASSGLLGHLRAICLGLPETAEVEAWGHPTFRVAGKIFTGFSEHAGAGTLGVKTTHELQAALVSSDPRFKIAAYVGKHGWVEMTLAAPVDWHEVEALVRESYRLVAPAKLAAAIT